MAELVAADLPHWAPGAQLYRHGDTWMLVEADLADYPNAGNVRFVRRPTVILYTDPDGRPTDLIPDFVFPPGTTPREALALAGFEETL